MSDCEAFLHTVSHSYQRTKKITIFEGPDGGGKSTAARVFATATDAHYVHFGPLKGIRRHLGRLFVEAMTPALLGIRDVVMDRSWLSEYPYGTVYRNGRDRLGPVACRMLERLALRCGAVVVYCLPAWPIVQQNFNRRRQDEYLQDVPSLKAVYRLYAQQQTHLPQCLYDYTKHAQITADILNRQRTPCHIVELESAGNFAAPYTLVGEQPHEWSDLDPWYRWPFGSFNQRSTSYWLSQQLERTQIAERDLCWINADQLITFSPTSIRSFFAPNTLVCALGHKAASFLTKSQIDYISFDNPRTHRRIQRELTPYPLLAMLTIKRP